MIRFYIENITLAVVFVLLAVAFASACAGRLPELEALTRNRYIGLLLGYPALILCVEYAKLVSPGFLLPFIWPLAILIPIASFFYIDFFAARALGGILIISSYDIVHWAFELRLPGAILITIIAWLYGIAGIWISGKPHALRDWFRLAAKSRKYAVCLMVLPVLAAAALLWSVAAQILK